MLNHNYIGNLVKHNEPINQVLLWSSLGSEIKHDVLGAESLSLVLIKSEQNQSNITGPVPKIDATNSQFRTVLDCPVLMSQ